MKSAKALSPPSWIARLALMGLAAASGIALAADPYPQPQPYPQAQYPQQQFQQQGAEQHPMRALFASSLAQVAQATGSAAVVMVADGLTGALKGWFDNRRARKSNNGALGNSYPQNAAPAPNYPAQGHPAGAQQKSQTQDYPPPSTGGTGYPNPSNMPAEGNTGGYPATGGYPTNDGYPTNSGYPTDNGYPATTPAPAVPPAPSQLYAGIAYEIHLLQRDGTTMPVDPSNYTFRTGEQFRVYYRPSLPGRVDVFNINAAGQNAQIDSAVIAAGELASLGPYEFMQLQGDETLILRLTPCASPALYAATRNIVKVQDPQLTNASNNTIGFSDCSSTATRGLKAKPKTRDIRKVSVEGGTTFALDPIAANELGGGDMAPRQITITLMHR